MSAALSLTACGSEAALGEYAGESCDLAEPPTDTRSGRLYLSTFWEDEKEQAAFDALLKHNPFPGYETTFKETRVDAQIQLPQIFKDGKQPDAFQANGGSDVLRWLYQGEAESMCPLNRLSEIHGWKERYFPAALAPVSCNGDLYALPVGIHRLNLLFYNRKLFESLTKLPQEPDEPLVEPGELQSVDQLLEQLKRVERLKKKSALSFTPLAVAAMRAWPLTILAFENVLLSRDKDAYQTLWRGGFVEGDDGTRQARLVFALGQMVSDLRTLVGFSVLDEREDWQEAIKQVGRGDALFTVNGDWAWAQIDDSQAAEVAAVPFPGTASTFVYTPDSFTVPRSRGRSDDTSFASGERSRAFLEQVVASREALKDFSALKHSIPPRMDFDVDELEAPELKATYRQFTDCSQGVGGCELLLATSGLAPPPGYTPCFDDVEALLFKAVTNVIPETFTERPRYCKNAWPPRDPKDAEGKLLDSLLEVARTPFAKDCER